MYWAYFDSRALQGAMSVGENTRRGLMGIVTSHIAMGAAAWQAYGTDLNMPWIPKGINSSLAVAMMRNYVQSSLSVPVTYCDKAFTYTGNRENDLLLWISKTSGNGTRVEIAIILGSQPRTVVNVSQTTQNDFLITVELGNIENNSCSTGSDVVSAIAGDWQASSLVLVFSAFPENIVNPSAHVEPLELPTSCIFQRSLPDRKTFCISSNSPLRKPDCLAVTSRLSRWNLESQRHDDAIEWSNTGRKTTAQENVPMCKYGDYCLSCEQIGEPNSLFVVYTHASTCTPGYFDALKELIGSNPFTRQVTVRSIDG